MGLEYYRALLDQGAIIVHAHMCKLREGYPQKPEDYIISDNIVLGLGEALSSLRCIHPFGTHVTNFGGNAGLTTKSSQVWMPELCDLLWKHILQHTYKGGPSLQLGVDDLTKFAMNELHWRVSDKVLELAGRHTALLATAIDTNRNYELTSTHEKALAIIYESLHHHDNAMPLDHFDFDSALDACNESNVLMLIEGGKLVLVPVTEAREKMPTQLLPPDLDHNWCLATIHVQCEDWVAPQTETEFKLCRQNLFWCNCDDEEMNILFTMGVLEPVTFEQLPLGSDGKTIRVWPTKFVRTIKRNSSTGVNQGRSRLVIIGIHHREGKEYSRKDAPTPLFSSMLHSIAEGTVRGAIKFQFDLAQFFQRTECDAPEPIGLIPSTRYQKGADGKKIYYISKDVAARCQGRRLCGSPAARHHPHEERPCCLHPVGLGQVQIHAPQPARRGQLYAACRRRMRRLGNDALSRHLPLRPARAPLSGSQVEHRQGRR
jgi:hypothetical protein